MNADSISPHTHCVAALARDHRPVRGAARREGERMARHKTDSTIRTYSRVDLSESSVYGKDEDNIASAAAGDAASEADLDRLEAITGGADEPVVLEGKT